MNKRLEQIEEALRTPDAFLAWMREQDPDRMIDPADTCCCFLHEFLRDRFQTNSTVFFTEIIIHGHHRRYGGATVPSETWNEKFQRSASLLVKDGDEESDLPEEIPVRVAIEVLETVMGGAK